MSLFGDKIYVVDTNAYRLPTSQDKQPHAVVNKDAAIQFWDMIRIETTLNKASLYTPSEVLRELEVQFYMLPEDMKVEIAKLLVMQNELKTMPTVEIEHQIRKMQAYIRSKYTLAIKEELGLKNTNYGGVSDARIQYAAWRKEAILVTTNVKDFILYPLLFDDPEEDVLYNLIANEYKHYSLQLFEMILTDPIFLQMKCDLEGMAIAHENSAKRW